MIAEAIPASAIAVVITGINDSRSNTGISDSKRVINRN